MPTCSGAVALATRSRAPCLRPNRPPTPSAMTTLSWTNARPVPNGVWMSRHMGCEKLSYYRTVNLRKANPERLIPEKCSTPPASHVSNFIGDPATSWRSIVTLFARHSTQQGPPQKTWNVAKQVCKTCMGSESQYLQSSHALALPIQAGVRQGCVMSPRLL